MGPTTSRAAQASHQASMRARVTASSGYSEHGMDETRKRALTGDAPGIGYTAFASEKLDPSSSSVGDSKEGFYVVRERAKNRWPSAAFEDAATTYYESMYALGKRLLPALARACGVDDAYFDAHWSASSHNCVLRFLKYSA